MPYFKPNESSLSLWKTVRLSQRDVSLQIPINFVTQPGVSVSSACFGSKVYGTESAQKCISNLLAIGYRRLYVDLYWSVERKHWSFCPVMIRRGEPGVTEPPTTPVTSAPPATLATGRLTGVDPDPTRTESPHTTSTAGNDSDPTPKSSATTTSSATAQAAKQNRRAPDGNNMQKLGPYLCDPSLDLSTMVRVLAEYFESTEDTLNAHLVYLIFNVHAAASSKSPEDPARAPPPDQLPSEFHLLGTTLSSMLDTYIYDPRDLAKDRQDLGKSWFGAVPSYRPIQEYFTHNENGRQSTKDGWPSEGYAVLAKAKRLVLGWGNVDPQMAAYNFSGDSNTIFSKDSVTSPANIEVKNSSIKAGCLYDSGSTDVPATGSSWASVTIPSDPSPANLSSLVLEMTSCGISPVLNNTLLNITADKNPEPYRNISRSTVWSWADGEPRNSTNSPDSRVTNTYRCAVIDLSLSGRWRASSCSEKLYAACRVRSSPYDWTLSNRRTTYNDAKGTCPDNATLAVPRTALENRYLYEYLLSKPDTLNKTSDLSEKHNVWLDFNSFDVPTCWLSGGPDGQCRYELDEDAMERRAVLVPTVAAIIVLIITASTLFVKCNANRRNSRRRRVIEGWEYEGVPS